MGDLPQLLLTGERTLPGIPEENYWFCRHLAAYELAAGRVSAGDAVLDSGSGEGYGTALLATSVGVTGLAVGLDRFSEAVRHATSRYPQARFVQADCAATPLRTDTFDLVVSLQVIEHLPDPEAYVAECARLVRPGGTFLCATPNRLTFSPAGRPKNPFHIVEFSAAELAELLAAPFDSVRIEGLVDDSPGLADALMDAALAGTQPPAWAGAAVAADDAWIVHDDHRGRHVPRPPGLVHGMTPTGDFVLVLHSHMPYLKHAGRWPVGEEWLFQAWGEAYLPVLDVLDRQAAAGRGNVLTLGLTPLLLHQMADPGLLTRFHDWLGNALLRCEMLAVNASDWPDGAERRAAASVWWQLAKARLDSFEARGRALVPSFARLAETGTIEVLGGPLTHPYLALQPERTVRAQIRLGLDAGERAIGVRPRGIWLPECAYTPGLEDVLAGEGVEHLVLDGPTILQAGGFSAIRRAWTLGDAKLAAVGRDLEVAYRVWSPTGGYPGHGAYREYHRWEWETGLKLWRVTDKKVPQAEKEWYDPELVPAVIDAQVANFRRLLRQSVVDPGDVVVACYDTELFGHWWLEGPRWLEQLLDELHTDDTIRPTTLAAHLDAVGTDGALAPPPGSWGLRKDFSIWDNEGTAGMWSLLEALDDRFREALLTRSGDLGERLLLQAARELWLAQCSDWPFMIGHDKSVDYAHERFDAHAAACTRCLDALTDLQVGSLPDAPAWLAGLEADHDIAPALSMESLVAAYE